MPNRLSKETSPYLLQHQHNPVDWYAWGPEAFEAARSADKPIFLSVGYSTCYWCHVMERESFENQAVAAEMNRRFICIKVDREERPDVDQLYMTAVQVIARQGGWPMSVWLTPDLRPFYGGTYFPPTDRGQRPGFVSLLQGIDDAYRNRKAEVEKSAGQITEVLHRLAVPKPAKSAVTIDDALVRRLIERSTSDYDPRAGGYGAAPKFPRQTLLELALVYNRTHPDETRLRQVLHTLDCMAHGGIRDQLGGGFHRYSTDAEWLVPHFEIMLYDNAMLGWCYVEAYRQTEDRRYAAVARGVFDFVLREMTSPQGAFYTAFDAEVDAREGLSYLWTRSEVEATLAEALGNEPTAEAQIHRFCRVYGLDDGPNFADPHHGNGLPDQNILFLADPKGDRVPALLDPELADLREVLRRARAGRKQPLLDTKIITGWNALMVRAMAFGGQTLQEPRYVEAAARAADFLLTRHATGDSGLCRTSRDGVQKFDGFLDDYACLIQAMIALHDAGASERWKDAARSLSKVMLRKFYDPVGGGFFFTDAAADDLLVRQKVAGDSPLPSGNGVAAVALLALDDLEPVRSTLSLFAESLQEQAEGMSALLQAAALYLADNPPLSASGGAKRADGETIAVATAWGPGGRLLVTATVAAGYHVNANKAGDGLVPTQLAVTGDAAAFVAAIEYPKPQSYRASDDEAEVPVYLGTVEMSVRFATPLASGTRVDLSLRYQACTESACMMPKTKTVSAVAP